VLIEIDANSRRDFVLMTMAVAEQAADDGAAQFILLTADSREWWRGRVGDGFFPGGNVAKFCGRRLKCR